MHDDIWPALCLVDLKCVILGRLQRCGRSPVELAPLDVNTILAYCHAQIFHGKHSTSLAAALSTTAISWSLNTEVIVLGFCSTVLSTLCSSRCCRSRRPTRAESAHSIATGGVGRSDSRKLVCIGGNIRDEFLCCQSKQAREVW